METEPRKRRKFDAGFKSNALNLAIQLGSVTEAANRLGIPANRLMIWRKVMKAKGTAQIDSSAALKEKILNLEKDNEALKRTMIILLR